MMAHGRTSYLAVVFRNTRCQPCLWYVAIYFQELRSEALERMRNSLFLLALDVALARLLDIGKKFSYIDIVVY